MPLLSPLRPTSATVYIDDVYRKKIGGCCHWDHLQRYINQITLYSCKSDYQILTFQVVSCVVGLRYGRLSEFLQRFLILSGLCRFCCIDQLLGIRSQTIWSSSFWKQGFPRQWKGNIPMRWQKVDSKNANYPTSSLESIVLVFPSPCRTTVSARYFQRSISCHGKASSIIKYHMHALNETRSISFYNYKTWFFLPVHWKALSTDHCLHLTDGIIIAIISVNCRQLRVWIIRCDLFL